MIRLDRKRFFEKLTLLREYWYPAPHDPTSKSRWMNGRMDYVKFIILSRARVGSNFLRGALNSHSQIVVYGELFQRLNAIRWELAGYSRSRRMLSLYRTNPVQFLESQVFHPFPGRVRAVGLSFYYHVSRARERIVSDLETPRPESRDQGYSSQAKEHSQDLPLSPESKDHGRMDQ